MAEPTVDRDPLEILADEFVSSQRRGESPSMDDYIAMYPDLADQIRELFPTIEAMERLKARSERSADGLASLGPNKLERLGEFKIIREVGRGGMGIVFEAMQESLGRSVALKVLPRQALLEQRHLARFNREAKIASRLHHTNIVQVYGVGQDDGFHYYVMQYVRGVGLDKVFNRLQDHDDAPCDELLGSIVSRAGQPGSDAYWRFVADTGNQAASAIAYAHDQGTLHRDVKPSNLLLDDEGIVWVTDFGLARATHTPKITQDGDLTGTLRYLAPERLDGKSDERGDIYGLGLTLYELATRHAAYEESDRSSLIARISKQAPARPRSIDPSIPRDLETIILKAISPDPRHRYQTAADMGRDLELFLDDRPVLARRIGPLERLWRWGRRNKAVASLTVSTLVLALVVAIVATMGYVRTSGALAREALQRQRAEAVSAVASDALDRVFSRLGPGRVVQSSLSIGSDGGSVRIVGQPAVSKATEALLEEMLPFYDRLAEQMDSNAELQSRAAAARRRIGDIRQRLGRYEQAAVAYMKAIDMYAAMDGSGSADRTSPVTIARIYNELGKTRKLAGKVDQAVKSHRDALGLLIDAPKTAPAEARFELARTYFFLGQRTPPHPGDKRKKMRPGGDGPRRRPRDDGPPGGDRPGLRDRPGRGRPPRRRPRDDRPHPDDRPDDHRPDDRRDDRPNDRPDGPPDDRPGNIFQGGPDGEMKDDTDRRERNSSLAKAVSLLTDLRSQQPKNPAYRHLLALCYREIVPDNERDAAPEIDKSIELLEGLVRDFPKMPDYSFDLCETYAAVETLGRDRSPNAGRTIIQRLDKALDIAERLVDDYPDMPEYLACEARINHRFAETHTRQDRLRLAGEHAQVAVKLQAELVKDFPGTVTYRIWLAAYRNAQARTLLADDKLTEAKSVVLANIADTKSLLEARPEMWYLHGLLMDAHHNLSSVLRRDGKDSEADKIKDLVEAHKVKLDEGRYRQGFEDKP
ncbi:MAG: protein kinase [Phycisphaerae bacterium]|nr:protein kinase [Phycisphaerae bacterium]